jgi:hypothetical protein
VQQNPSDDIYEFSIGDFVQTKLSSVSLKHRKGGICVIIDKVDGKNYSFAFNGKIYTLKEVTKLYPTIFHAMSEDIEMYDASQLEKLIWSE